MVPGGRAGMGRVAGEELQRRAGEARRIARGNSGRARWLFVRGTIMDFSIRRGAFIVGISLVSAAGASRLSAQAVLRGVLYDDATGERLRGTVMLVDPATDAPLIHMATDTLGQFTHAVPQRQRSRSPRCVRATRRSCPRRWRSRTASVDDPHSDRGGRRSEALDRRARAHSAGRQQARTTFESVALQGFDTRRAHRHRDCTMTRRSSTFAASHPGRVPPERPGTSRRRSDVGATR